MIVRKFSEAKAYEAPNHRGYKSFRVYGAEMGGSQTLVFGISHFLPGGGAGPDASPPEKIYYVLSGELTVIAGGKETVAKAGDRGRCRAGEVIHLAPRAGRGSRATRGG
jgi:quercetin dioxygenase-like cupin family protein